MKQLKIAIYSGEIPSTTFIERLIEGLANDNCKILLFGFQTKKVKYSKNVMIYSYSNKINKFIILLKYSILLKTFNSKEKKKLDEIIKNKKINNAILKVKYYTILFHKPDIFHLQWAKSVDDWIWVQEFGIKLVLSLRGTHITISPKADENLERVYKENFPKIDGFHAVSNAMKNEVLQYGIQPEKIKVIYSGLDFLKLNFNSSKTNTAPFKIISIGRAHWVKGYNFALDACTILKEKNFDFHYTIIGVDNNEELVFQRNQLQLNNEVLFEKQLNFNEIIQEIRNADLILLSSIEEGIPNVVLEAMAFGTLVIATDCGGISEIIEDKKNGFLIPKRDSVAIAERIIEVSKLDDKTKFEILKNARETVEKNNNISATIGQMKQLYLDAL